MELIRLIVGFIVLIAERLALGLMVFMLLSWVLTMFEPVLRRFYRWLLDTVARLRWVREAVQFWTALRLVRRQLVPS